MKTLMKTSLVMLLAIYGSLAFALTADQIAHKVDQRDDGDKGTAEMEMILIDQQGQKRTRQMQKFEMDVGEDTHSAIFFTAPADVRNSAFLTYDYADSEKDDDQWLYLPELRKTKRIVSSDKSNSFMGSDFTYADMTQRDIADYQYRIAKESEVRGQPVWIMEAVPKHQRTIDETGYQKSYMFVRKDNFVVVRAIHFQTDGKIKYMDIKKLEQIDGIWVGTEISMATTKNKVTLHQTLLRFQNVLFNQAFGDEMFTVRRIEKGL
ncbi:outer membrane lipoprotein-sorting protein [Hydrogenovibrio sp. SC-1]|nr:outer membrane lipoprotein-sorting protein [Hydrogenovibrio sp. SC-1]